MSQLWSDSSTTPTNPDVDSSLLPGQDIINGITEELKQHGDHVDVGEEDNAWADEDFSWYDDWLHKERSRTQFKTNEQLYQSPYVQQRMQTFRNIRKGGYMPLDTYFKRTCLIPLFSDENGEEYQICSGQGMGSSPEIPIFRCPAVTPRGQLGLFGFFEIEYRMNTRENHTKLALPKHVVSLGQLFVKTSARSVPATEQTEYSVVVDVDDEDLPVWILASRRQLEHRCRGKGYVKPIEMLPIFDRAMEVPNETLHKYHDAACILSSVRRLGAQASDADAPNYREACELVRKSCASVDPAAFWQPREKLLEYMSEESIPSRDAVHEKNVLLDDPV